jgi:hypothetical protein
LASPSISAAPRVRVRATTRALLDGVPAVGMPLCVSARPSPVPCRAKGGWVKPGAGYHESLEARN